MVTHKKQWEFLKGKFEASQLSHAYLFSGQDGIGKKEFAKEFIKLVHPGFEAVIEKENFPDLLVVKSINSDSSIKNERDMMELDVKQIRDVNTFLSYKSYYGGYKTVIIEDAHRMNHEAQNSFLKTLEEPKGQTLIMLISSKPDALLPTIFSRCQTMTFFPFESSQATKQEQALLQELLSILPAELATKFQYTKKANLEGDNANAMLKVLQRYFRNILLAKIGAVECHPFGRSPVGGQIPVSRSQSDRGSSIESGQFNSYSIEKLKKIIRLVEALHKQLSTTNANPKLALEILLTEI